MNFKKLLRSWWPESGAAAGPAAQVTEMREAYAKALESLGNTFERKMDEGNGSPGSWYRIGLTMAYSDAVIEVCSEKDKLSRLAMSMSADNQQPTGQPLLESRPSSGGAGELSQEAAATYSWLETRRKAIERMVTGALRSCITAHGPITAVQIGSATKRIVSQLMAESPSSAPATGGADERAPAPPDRELTEPKQDKYDHT